MAHRCYPWSELSCCQAQDWRSAQHRHTMSEETETVPSTDKTQSSSSTYHIQGERRDIFLLLHAISMWLHVHFTLTLREGGREGGRSQKLFNQDNGTE